MEDVAEVSDEPVLTLTGTVGIASLAPDGVLQPEMWPLYRKKVLTHAARVAGPFTVLTSEGELACADGYLAVDARGYPYPIATDEFRQIYERADDTQEQPRPPVRVHEIAVSHSFGIITKEVAEEATVRLLRAHGLLAAPEKAPA